MLNIKDKIINLAHNKVNNNILRKKLIRPDCCYICNYKTKLHGHHWDYSKLLEVTWLCPKCHKMVHKRIRQMKHNILTCTDKEFELIIKMFRERSL